MKNETTTGVMQEKMREKKKERVQRKEKKNKGAGFFSFADKHLFLKPSGR